MKTQIVLLLAPLLSLAPVSYSALVTETYSQTVSATDGHFDGLTPVNLTMNAPWTISSITDFEVQLNFVADGVSPALNGDLLASVFIGDGFGPAAVLFDGSTLASPNTSGMNVVFSDNAADSIQSTGPSSDTPPSLVGTYRAHDGLNSIFNGVDPRSDPWHLNLSDFGSIGSGTVVSWEIDITGSVQTDSVPERVGCAGVFALVGVLAIHQLLRRSTGQLELV